MRELEPGRPKGDFKSNHIHEIVPISSIESEKDNMEIDQQQQQELHEQRVEEALGDSLHSKEVSSALYEVASKWSDVLDARNVTLKPLKGAMTNHIYECHWPLTSDRQQQRKVLLRIYGEKDENTDILFDRKHEVATFEFVSSKGQGPRLLHRIKNGRIEEFIHARTLSASDLRDECISSNIAAKLWEFHQLQGKSLGPREPQLWNRLRDWSDKALKLNPKASKFDILEIQEEIQELQRKVPKSTDVIGFCHNDLQYGNIMLDDVNQSLTIIDYEYASYNPVAFDIANHFCEMAADYHTDTPHLLNYALYPDDTIRRRFIRTYLETSGGSVDESQLEELMKQVDRYELASHIHWVLWGIISAAVSDIKFDFLEYAMERWRRYKDQKNIVS